MENFLLQKKQSSTNQSIETSFEKYFPGSSGVFRYFGEYILFLFKKGIQFPDNFHEENGYFIGVCGTPVYKGLSYTTGLKEMLLDEMNGRFDQNDLIGHYYIFIWDKSKLKVINDGSGLLKSYYDIRELSLSSSFLVLTEISVNPYSLNRIAITENLLAGGITGGETILNEIKELKTESVELFHDLSFMIPNKYNVKNPRTRKEAFENQIYTLEKYFLSLKNIADEFGVDTGLTGGMDSRLILALVKKYFSTYQVHSHFRKGQNIDLEIAREITRDQQISFVSPEVVQWEIMNEEEKKDIFERTLRFCDGQMRQHCYWNEEYNTSRYRERVTGRMGLGLQGIGGEQYRNVDRVLMKGVNFENWINYQYIGKYAGTGVIKDKICKELTSNIKEKISGLLGFEVNKKKITLLDLKRISNEVLISSYRGIRTNSENRISFSLSPFADFKVSQAAYSIVPFLNQTYNFEIDLIKYFAPDLAKYRSAYGFSFKTKEPFLSYSIPFFAHNFIPYCISLRIKEEYKTLKRRTFHKIDLKKEGFLKACLNNLNELEIPLNLENLLDNFNTSIMVFSMGYLLGELKSKLK